MDVASFVHVTHSFGLVRIVKIFVGVCAADLILKPHVSCIIRIEPLHDMFANYIASDIDIGTIKCHIDK